jgi:hypothetical protein
MGSKFGAPGAAGPQPNSDSACPSHCPPTHNPGVRLPLSRSPMISGAEQYIHISDCNIHTVSVKSRYHTAGHGLTPHSLSCCGVQCKQCAIAYPIAIDALLRRSLQLDLQCFPVKNGGRSVEASQMWTILLSHAALLPLLLIRVLPESPRV